MFFLTSLFFMNSFNICNSNDHLLSFFLPLLLSSWNIFRMCSFSILTSTTLSRFNYLWILPGPPKRYPHQRWTTFQIHSTVIAIVLTLKYYFNHITVPKSTPIKSILVIAPYFFQFSSIYSFYFSQTTYCHNRTF